MKKSHFKQRANSKNKAPYEGRKTYSFIGVIRHSVIKSDIGKAMFRCKQTRIVEIFPFTVKP